MEAEAESNDGSYMKCRAAEVFCAAPSRVNAAVDGSDGHGVGRATADSDRAWRCPVGIPGS